MTADPTTGTPTTGTSASPRYLPPTSPLTPTPSKRKRRWGGAQSAALLGYLWLLLVIVCVGAMSWTGLVRFAKDVLGLSEPLCYGVPVALDGSAITLAFLALRGVLSGGAAGLPRLLAVIVVAASSGFNYYQARQTGQGGAAEVFFAGMSVLVYVMFEVILRHNRRQHLAELGAIEPPLARFRMARWLRFPLKTWRAWSAAVDQGLTDPTQALTVVRRVPPEMSEARAIRGQAPDQGLLEPAPASPQVSAQAREPVASKHAEPASKRARNEEARQTVRAMLLAHGERGEELTGQKAADAIGLSRSRAQQLIVSEKAALAAEARGRNGSTP